MTQGNLSDLLNKINLKKAIHMCVFESIKLTREAKEHN